MAKRIAVLFESAGLKADVVPGKKKQVKKVKFTPYVLNFDTGETRHTAELFKLRYLEASQWRKPVVESEHAWVPYGHEGAAHEKVHACQVPERRLHRFLDAG
jgi:hypothetical protein